MANKNGAYVVSNDQYTPYQDQFPWIKQRRTPVVIVNGIIELYEPKLEKDLD